MDKKTQVRKFDKQAPKYERMQKNDPTARFRRRIFPEAEGKVLEVAIGAGLNLPYYKKVTELIGIDFSLEMLRAVEGIKSDYSFPIELQQADVETIDFAKNSFDTIVSSFSFCSYKNPVKVLNRFSRWCKPDGKILMLEHGESTNRLLRFMQKGIDPIAFKMIGCHQNRKILHEVQSSNLEILKVERAVAGILYFIWAKPAI